MAVVIIVVVIVVASAVDLLVAFLDGGAVRFGKLASFAFRLRSGESIEVFEFSSNRVWKLLDSVVGVVVDHV